MQKKKTDRLKDWKDKIAVLFLVREELQRLDKSGIWKYYYPELAATEEQLVAVESKLGHAIDADYRDFLLCTNGWKCFCQSVNLFGANDLAGSDLMSYALEMLATMNDAFSLEYTGFSIHELLPIAATFEDKDLHVITRATSHQPGVIIWFAGQEIERYPNFEEYFLAMADYNRLEVDRLKKADG